MEAEEREGDRDNEEWGRKRMNENIRMNMNEQIYLSNNYYFGGVCKMKHSLGPYT